MTLVLGGSAGDLPSLIVTVDDTNRPYATPNPPLTGSIEGLEAGDDISATYITDATFTSSAGTYAITALLVDTDGKLGKYRLITRSGILKIDPVPLNVAVDDKTRRYGAANPPLTGTISGLQYGDEITATYSTGATPGTTVGAYPIIAMLEGAQASLGNYSVSIRNGLLTVRPLRPILITSIAFANNRPHLIGSADAETTYTIQRSSDLIQWTDIGAAVTDTSGRFEFEDETTFDEFNFFRVALP